MVPIRYILEYIVVSVIRRNVSSKVKALRTIRQRNNVSARHCRDGITNPLEVGRDKGNIQSMIYRLSELFESARRLGTGTKRGHHAAAGACTGGDHLYRLIRQSFPHARIVTMDP